MRRTEDNSKKMLLNVFGKRTRSVWLEVNGVEVETPLERLKVHDIIVVHMGETVRRRRVSAHPVAPSFPISHL